jgi:diguanylate cyclase (GGDEF)-like protein
MAHVRACAVVWWQAQRVLMLALLMLALLMLHRGAHAGDAALAAQLARAEHVADRHPRAAAKLLDELLAQQPKLDERERLWVEMIRILISVSLDAPGESQALIERNLPALRALGDQAWLAQAVQLLAHSLSFQGRASEALEVNGEALALADVAGVPAVRIETMCDRVGMLLTKHRFEEAFALMERAARLAREFPSHRSNAIVAWANARLATVLGDRARVIEFQRLSVEAYRADDMPSSAADALIGLGLALLRDDRPAEALAPLDESVRLFESLGDPRGVAIAEAPRGIALAATGRGAEALRASDRALSILSAHTDSEELLFARLDRARVANLLQRYDLALQALDQARPQVERDQEPTAQQIYARESARAFAATGRWREAYAASVALQEYETRLSDARLARQLAAQRGQLESERLARENESLRREGQATRRALDALEREARMQTLLGAFGAALIIAALIGLWWQRQINRRIAHIAATDELTGAFNRRRIVEIGKEAFGAFRAVGAPVAVALVDLDHFKSINDRYGHSVGDAALRVVAETLKKNLREADRLGRYGGEEFAVVLPHATAAEAAAVAERLRAAIAALPRDILGIDGALTLSVGVAIAAANDADFDAIVVRADQALYRAKENGRNRVEIAAA